MVTVEGWMSLAPAHDFTRSVRQAIETLSCGDGYPTLRETAAFLQMSVRTLQRRLGAAGVSHDILVADSRFAMAAAVLEATDAKILDLALDLGYSDHANFTRAFRRWAGCSPQQYRARHRVPFVAPGAAPSAACRDPLRTSLRSTRRYRARRRDAA